MSVVSVPVPTTVDSPAVSEIVAEPRVMVSPTAMLFCPEAVCAAPGVARPDASSQPFAELPGPTLAVSVAAAADSGVRPSSEPPVTGVMGCVVCAGWLGCPPGCAFPR